MKNRRNFFRFDVPMNLVFKPSRDEARFSFGKTINYSRKGFCFESDDFDKLVRKHVAPLTDNPDRYKNFECVAEFEWDRGQQSASIDAGDETKDFYLKYDRKDIMSGESYIGFFGLLVFMHEHELIDAGSYSIDVDW